MKNIPKTKAKAPETIPADEIAPANRSLSAGADDSNKKGAEEIPKSIMAKPVDTGEGARGLFGDDVVATAPDIDAARAFIAALTGSPDTQMVFQTFDDTKERKSPRLARVISGTVAEHFPQLADLNKRGAGIFLTVQECKPGKRRNDNITSIRAIINDFDGDDAVALAKAAAERLPFSIEVESSPGKRHLYWLTNPGEFARDEYTPFIERMITVTGADPNAKDLARVLRLPGFYHRKGDPHMVRMLNDYSEFLTYTKVEIADAFGIDLNAIGAKVKAKTDRAAKAYTAEDCDPLDYVINEATATKLRSALKAIDATSRDSWIKVCAALSRSGEVGFEIFHDWSKTATKGYVDEEDCRAKFDELAPDSKSHFAAIFTMAQEKGWQIADASKDLLPVDASHCKYDEVEVVPNYPPPFLGRMASLVDAILKASPMPQPNIALMSAVVGMAACLPGMFRLPDGLRLNLYGLITVRSTGGKEKPVNCAMEFARQGGAKTLSTPASGEALEDALVPARGIFVSLREAAHILQVLNGSGAAPHVISMERVLLDLFSASDRTYDLRTKANQPPRDPIPYPTVSVMLASTPEKLGEVLNIDNILSGLLGRLLVAHGHEDVELNLDAQEFRLPGGVLFDIGKLTANNNSQGQIVWSTQADVHLRQRAKELDGQRQAMEKDGRMVAAALTGRTIEKIKRVSGVLAVFDNIDHPTITLPMLQWADVFVAASNETMRYFISKHLHGGEVLADAAKIIDLIKQIKRGKAKAHTPSQQALINCGHCPRTLVLKLFKKEVKAFDTAVEHLVKSDQAIAYNHAYVNGGREQGAAALDIVENVGE